MTAPPGAASLVFWAVSAFVLAVALVPLCRRVAFATGHVARPRQDRWHSRPTALFGGVAIAAPALMFGVVSGDAARIALPLAGGALIFAVGLVDDLISLKPSTKLIVEIALASLFVLHGERLQWTPLPAADMLLTMVWLVGVTNAFNLLDNMDGLCAGVALIAGVALVSGLAGRADVAAETRYLAVVLGTTAGFLLFNLHPASIFMGDAGSLFLGLTLAALTLTAGGPAHDRSRILSIVGAPVLVLLVPIFDTMLVTVLRILSGRSVSSGGRDHSSHRLVAIGLSERSAVRVLWVLAAAAGAIGIALRRLSGDPARVVAVLFVLAMVVFAVYLAQVRVYETVTGRTPPGVTPVLAGFMHKRRVAEVLLDVCLITIAYYAGWRLRFEGPEWNAYVVYMWRSFPIALSAQLVALFIFGAYRGVWRHFGLMDAVTFGKAVVAGMLAAIAGILYLYRFENYSRGVFVIYPALLMLLLCGSRASFRLIGEFARRRRSGPRLAIYAAGDAASVLLREMMNDASEHYRMIGFVNDDPASHRLRIEGYPVLGGSTRLLQLIDAGGVDVIVLGARGIDRQHVEQVEQACRSREVTLLRLTFRLETLVSSV